MMDADEFKRLTGRMPEHDDLERVNCDKVGAVGHWQCGWCDEHCSPNFSCGCIPIKDEEQQARNALQNLRKKIASDYRRKTLELVKTLTQQMLDQTGIKQK